MCSYNSAIWRPVKQTRHGWYISFASLWLNSFHLESTQFTCVFLRFYLPIHFHIFVLPWRLSRCSEKLHNSFKLCFPEFLFFYFFGIPFAPWDLSHCTWNLHNFLVFFWNCSYIFCRPEAYLITLEIWIFFSWFLKKNIWFASIGNFSIY